MYPGSRPHLTMEWQTQHTKIPLIPKCSLWKTFEAEPKVFHFSGNFISNGLPGRGTKRPNKTKSHIKYKAEAHFGSWPEEITLKVGRLWLFYRITYYPNALMLSSNMIIMMTPSLICMSIKWAERHLCTVWILCHGAHWQSGSLHSKWCHIPAIIYII